MELSVMKFFTESAARCAARIGLITELARMPGAVFETPLLMIYTKRGSVPHLTKDVFQMVTFEQEFLMTSLSSAIPMLNSVKQTNSFAEFVSMKEYPFFLSIQDPAVETSRGYQEKDSIAVWTRGGRSSFNANSYMDAVEVLKPDMYIALCDGDTDENSSSKRVSKALERSKRLFIKCMKRHNSSDVLKSTAILGPVEGGWDLKAREISVQYLIDKNPDGFVIDGLHVNGNRVQKIDFDSIKNVTQHTMNLLPVSKMKVSLGCWNPTAVLELIEHGVDVFDSSYPYVVTESSKALTFMCFSHQHSNKNTGHEISVVDKCFTDDFSPICETCECLTCKNHTRAYLNHLCQTKELLGSVLLMVHNTHQYLQFFKAIRENIKNSTLTDFKSKIGAQFTS
ncbi:queuine tRNA-ribosyltransferase accessory subunit 2 isoform X2 [Venturia canescens]|uniref:queuine tRNA-ribosyltransferase accessory subunit 2 isoform X2 n=1 Tax=Venturia canescens TaxID=32260 RepID=UPI001C9CA03C|nr:queuine tRNA-ribosyltransferase accessory subunit 2 isoform X2 [Venturia canescens]